MNKLIWFGGASLIVMLFIPDQSNSLKEFVDLFWLGCAFLAALALIFAPFVDEPE